MRPEWHAMFDGRYRITSAGCWEWTGARASDMGYGRITTRGKPWWAHRLSRFLEFGDLPEAVCHRCDNPPCINPDHLRAGTLSDNQTESWEKGRHDRSCMVVVRPEHIAVIRAAASGPRAGRRARIELASARCGFSSRTAYRLLAGRSPGHAIVARRAMGIAA